VISIRSVIKIILLLGVAGGVGYGWIYIHKPHTFPIREVKVAGVYHYVSPGTLQNVMMPYVENGFFNVNVVGAKMALAKIPGIDSAEVRRVWPGTVEVSLQEEKAVAKWGNHQLLSHDGEVFQPLEVFGLEGLPMLIGDIKDSHKILRMYDEIKKMLPQDKHIVKLQFTGNQWQVFFIKGPSVVLGSKDIQKRLSTFLHYAPIVEKESADKEIQFIDMRYPSGFAVMWQKTA
jgi:cell division protein FtsQ